MRQIRMPLVHFFETSFGRTYERDMVLVEAKADGISGWGEVTAGENPFYNEEWTDSSWLLLKSFIAPRVLNHPFETAAEVGARTSHIRGHKMSRGGMEVAVWDLEARMLGKPLYQHIGGGARTEIPCGVSIGIQDSVPQLLKKIETEIAAGYQRIKMKIKPGWDVEVIREVRKEFPSIKLMADANSAYTLADADLLKQLDEFYLMMIEQPLEHDEIIDHAVLQAKLHTPICLDECIRTAHQAEQAIRLKACGIINIKLGRVAGFAEAKRVHDVCQAAGVPVSGAAACWKQASDAPTTSRSPRCRTSFCLVTSPPANAIGNGTLSSRLWRPRRAALSSCATNPASATRWTSTIFANLQSGRKYCVDQ